MVKRMKHNKGLARFVLGKGQGGLFGCLSVLGSVC